MPSLSPLAQIFLSGVLLGSVSRGAVPPAGWETKADETLVFIEQSDGYDVSRVPEYWRRLKDLGSSLDIVTTSAIAAAKPSARTAITLLAADYFKDSKTVEELVGWYATSPDGVTAGTRKGTLDKMKALGYPPETYVPQTYVLPRILPRGQIPPYPTFPVHLRAEDRTSWEALLLCPTKVSAQKCTEALADIHDPRSLPIIMERFRMLAKDAANKHDWHRRRGELTDLMGTLFKFGGSESIACLLDCVEIAETDPGTPKDDASIRFFVLSLLSAANPSSFPADAPPRHDKWKLFKPLIKTMLADPNLAPARHALLEKALAMMPKE